MTSEIPRLTFRKSLNNSRHIWAEFRNCGADGATSEACQAGSPHLLSEPLELVTLAIALAFRWPATHCVRNQTVS
jgi:hypothetical protein